MLEESDTTDSSDHNFIDVYIRRGIVRWIITKQTKQKELVENSKSYSR